MKTKDFLIIIGLIITVSVIVLAIFLVNSNKETPTYLVTFLTDGGSLVNSQTVNQGEKVIKPIDPIKEGYTFMEWTYNDQTYDFSLDVNSNLELKAKWIEIKEDVKTFTIKFNSDGGTTIPNQIVEKEKQVKEPDEPKKDGYTFKGWTLDGKEYNFETKVIKDLELKAKWEKIKISNNSSNNTNNTNNKPNTSTNSKPNTNTSTSTNTNTNKPNENEVDNITLKTPTLTNVMGGIENGVMFANLSIVFQGPYADDLKENKLPFAGYEVYEKKDGKYTLIDTITSKVSNCSVTVDVGESKTFVARVYALNKSNKKVYSDYSNEVKIDNSTLQTPYFKNVMGGTENGVMFANLSIVFQGPYAEDLEANILPFAGYEVYEKKDGKYTLIDTITSKAGYCKVTVDVGESKTLVARVYALNKSNKKVYSDYSNEVKIDNSTLQTPYLKNVMGGIENGVMFANLSIVFQGPYAEDLESNILPFAGYEVYEKKAGKYTLIDTITSKAGYCSVTVDVGESKTLVARVYSLNKSNKKIYSDYSNEVVISNND